MIGLVDYGAGNMRSVANALGHLRLPFRVCTGPADIAAADRVLLPGVGHFGRAVKGLEMSGMLTAIARHIASEKPLLGICLGLQLLLAGSEEAEEAGGLGFLPGRCLRIQARQVPHMGWNRVQPLRSCPLFEEGDPAQHFYFAHSYVACLDEPGDLLGEVDIEGAGVPAVIGRGPVIGVQFHPEKSGAAGLDLLSRFGRC